MAGLDGVKSGLSASGRQSGCSSSDLGDLRLAGEYGEDPGGADRVAATSEERAQLLQPFVDPGLHRIDRTTHFGGNLRLTAAGEMVAHDGLTPGRRQSGQTLVQQRTEFVRL